MFFTTHVLLPVATQVWLAKRKKFNLTKLLIVSTATGALLPDVDLLLHQPMIEHHQTLWHAPLLWLVVLLIGLIIGKLVKKPSWLHLIIGFSVGTLSHMLLDTFGVGQGIAWLAPFSWQEYSFTPITSVTAENWLGIYLTSKVFLVEMIVTLPLLIFLFLEWRGTRAISRNSLQ